MSLTDEQIESIRPAFEEWFKSNYHTRLSRNMPDRSYNDPHAYSMFIAWLAATAPLLERVAELERELEALRKDAERYRWLRSSLADRDKGKSHHFCSIRAGCPEELDAAIDAAKEQ
jgi:hypothetical protein